MGIGLLVRCCMWYMCSTGMLGVSGWCGVRLCVCWSGLFVCGRFHCVCVCVVFVFVVGVYVCVVCVCVWAMCVCVLSVCGCVCWRCGCVCVCCLSVCVLLILVLLCDTPCVLVLVCLALSSSDCFFSSRRVCHFLSLRHSFRTSL